MWHTCSCKMVTSSICVRMISSQKRLQLGVSLAECSWPILASNESACRSCDGVLWCTLAISSSVKDRCMRTQVLESRKVSAAVRPNDRIYDGLVFMLYGQLLLDRLIPTRLMAEGARAGAYALLPPGATILHVSQRFRHDVQALASPQGAAVTADTTWCLRSG